MDNEVLVKSIRDEFKGAIIEIGANRTLGPKDDYNKGFNEGMNEAMAIIGRYIRGEGLFQP